MPDPDPDPENSRFYASGAEMPGYDKVEAEPPPSMHRGHSPEPEELRIAPVRVYSRSPNPMQGGPAHVGEWIVEFEPHLKPGIDPLMGWTSSADPQRQVRLTFETREAAESYCRRQKLNYELEEPPVRRPKRKSYSDNFTPFEGNGPKPIFPH